MPQCSNYVSICSVLAAILNAKFLLVAIAHVPQVTVSYLIALIVTFDIVASP